MKRPASVLAVVGLLAVIQSALAGRDILQAAAANTTGPVRMCVPAAASPAALTACTEAMAGANAAAAGITFTCVAGGSPDACMRAISDGDADLTSFGAADVYRAQIEYGLEPLTAELYGNSTEATEYYAVAVVPAAFCAAGDASFAALAGKRSCHTGYRKTAGWVAPVGYLVESGAAPVVATAPGVAADAQTVAAFFSSVCAPRTTPEGPAAGGAPWAPLCSACGGDCTEGSPYYDYPGALRGLMEGACDVAFTKHDVAGAVAADGSDPAPWATVSTDGLRLLCPGGECAPVDGFERCNLARVPSHSVVGAAALQGSDRGAAIKTSLAGAGPAFLAAATEVGGIPNFVFAEGTTGVVRQDKPFEEFFDAGMMASFKGIQQLEAAATGTDAPAAAPAPLPVTPAPKGEYRMCVPLPDGSSPGFLQACTAALARASNASAGVAFSCVAGGSAAACAELVAAAGAELTKFGPSDVYLAHRDFGLEPLATEFYGGDAGNEYYAVAVVKADFCEAGDVSLASLKGKRSCHTGYRRSAGWTMPLGFLVQSGTVAPRNADPGVNADAETVAAFFSGVCAPRVTDDGPRVGGKPYEPLCSACGGDCTEGSPYYDYAGTVRGVMESVCDVAFTKHDVAGAVATDGSDPAPWATVGTAGLRLLCPGGGCAPVFDFKRCNLAAIPAQAIVGKVDLQRTQAGAAVKAALVAAGADPAFLAAGIQLGDAQSFLFSPGTARLDPVEGSFLDYFGAATAAAYRGVETLDEAPEAEGGGGGGLGAGAIVGIVLGVLAAGIAVGVAGLVAYKRSGGRYINFDVDASKPITIDVGGGSAGGSAVTKV